MADWERPPPSRRLLFARERVRQLLPFQVSDSASEIEEKSVFFQLRTAAPQQGAPLSSQPSTALNLHPSFYFPLSRSPSDFGALAGQQTRRHSSSIAKPLILATMAIWKRLTASYTGQFDPTHRFETSWILPPGVLFGARALLSLYAFVTLFTIFGWNGAHGRQEDSQRTFSYFTHLTYWGLAFYFAFSAAHTGSYWLTGTPFLARWPKWLQVAHSMFYSTIVVYPWIVTG
jgi:hypothetical protein